MNISSLNIYGFGKLIDKQIDLVSGINVIEGKNEIGKTTLMAFIRAVFLGLKVEEVCIKDMNLYMEENLEVIYV